jgi:hypothetical protein
MPTSIHIPTALLAEVSRRAKSLRVSRNRYIVSVLEKEVAHRTTWSPAFIQSLERLGTDGDAFADVLDDVISQRTSKRPVRF